MADATTLLESLLHRALARIRVDAKRMDVTVEDVHASLFRDVEVEQTRLTVTLRFSKQEAPK